MSEGIRRVWIDISDLEKAFIQYDEASDTLYINLSDEEADEVLMLENNIVIRIKEGRLIGLTILELSRRVKEI